MYVAHFHVGYVWNISLPIVNHEITKYQPLEMKAVYTVYHLTLQCGGEVRRKQNGLGVSGESGP